MKDAYWSRSAALSLVAFREPSTPEVVSEAEVTHTSVIVPQRQDRERDNDSDEPFRKN